MQTHTYTSVYLWKIPEFPSDPGQHLTWTGTPSYINGAFLLGGGKPLSHTYTRQCAQHRATPSHAPTLQASVNVRPWETGFILERYGIFTPFVTVSLRHTHIHTCWVFQHYPMKGKPWLWCTTLLCMTQNNQNTSTFMLWETLSCRCKV